MFSSQALKHELAVKGNQLLRAVARSFSSPEDSVVIGALTKLSPDHRPVKLDELAAYLNVSQDYVTTRLGQYLHDHFLTKEESHTKLPYTQVFIGGTLVDKEEALRLVVDIFTTRGNLQFDGEEYTQKMLLEKSLDWLVKKLPDTRKLSFPATDRHPASTQYTYFEDGQQVLIAKISEGRRKEHIIKYFINYENIVYVVKYKIASIQSMYDRRSDPNFYYCPNYQCIHYTTFVPANELYMRSISNTTRGGSGGGGGHLGGGFSSQANSFNNPNRLRQNPTSSLSSNSNANPLVQLGNPIPNGPGSGGMGMGLGSGGHSNAMQNLNQQRPGGGLGGGLKRPTPSSTADLLDASSYPCERCENILVKCGGKSIENLKREFLSQTDKINQLTHDVFEILSQTRAYEQKKMLSEISQNTGDNGLGGGNSGGSKVGVGAKGGCSSAADLASRVEKLKTPLPWDELSVADHERLLLAQQKQNELEEQERRQTKLREEEEEREKQYQEYLREQAKRKRKMALKKSIFGGSDGTDDLESDAALLVRFGGDLAEVEAYKLKKRETQKLDILAGYKATGGSSSTIGGGIMSLDELQKRHEFLQKQQEKMNNNKEKINIGDMQDISKNEQEQLQQLILQQQQQQQQYEDPGSFWVSIGGPVQNGGIRMRLEDVTEQHLDLMTEEEFTIYSDLADGVNE